MSIYARDRHSALESDSTLDIAERAVGMIELLRRIPPQWQEQTVAGSNSRIFRVSVSSAPLIRSEASGEKVLEAVRGFLADSLPELSSKDIMVAKKRPDESLRLKGIVGGEDLLQLSLRLDDGSWLNITGMIQHSDALWPMSAAVYMLSVLLGVVVLGMWLVYRVTSPLTTFAEAADRLGKNLRSEPLAETGPSEVAKAAKALNEMQSRLQRLVENRTELLTSISHDLRTSITLLRLRAELMPPGSYRDRLIETLEEMESMVGSVLDFSRETFQEEPSRVVDLSALLQSVCEDRIDAGASVRFDAPESLRHRCRRVALKRAINNLVDNAIRYAGDTEVLLSDAASEIVIEIRDEGPGFDPGELDELLLPSFRAERPRRRETGGAGLGLSITKAIVESHGGTLEIANRSAGGASSVIRLPK
jgi:signal transduction histidine kinase